MKSIIISMIASIILGAIAAGVKANRVIKAQDRAINLADSIVSKYYDTDGSDEMTDYLQAVAEVEALRN